MLQTVISELYKAGYRTHLERTLKSEKTILSDEYEHQQIFFSWIFIGEAY